MGSEKSETAVLPIGLKLDELLEAGEEIFRDCENTDPRQQGSVDVLSLARRIVELVLDCPMTLFKNVWQHFVPHSSTILKESQNLAKKRKAFHSICKEASNMAAREK